MWKMGARVWMIFFPHLGWLNLSVESEAAAHGAHFFPSVYFCTAVLLKYVPKSTAIPFFRYYIICRVSLNVCFWKFRGFKWNNVGCLIQFLISIKNYWHSVMQLRFRTIFICKREWTYAENVTAFKHNLKLQFEREMCNLHKTERFVKPCKRQICTIQIL